jgi:hypothetical protein
VTIDVNPRTADDAGLLQCEQCIKHAQRAGETLVMLEQAEIALRSERLKSARLKEEMAKMIATSEHARKVYEHWKQTCRPNARTFEGKRREKVTARLRESYTVEDLCKAIDGAKKAAYVKDGVRYDDLELICRDATKVDAFMAKADASAAAALPSKRAEAMPRWQQHDIILGALNMEYASTLLHDKVMGYWISKCPACLTDYSFRLTDGDHGPVAWCESCPVTPEKIIDSLEAP